jgi:iron(III) transport system ATP-binding protein
METMVDKNNSEALRLEVNNLYHHFDGSNVVENVSLSVRPGQVTCLLGPSGCGKSTTLRIIAGVERQQKGSILLDGKVVSDSKIHVQPDQRRVGLMFQDFALFPHLDINSNVGFGLDRRDKSNQERINVLLARVGLDGFQKKYPHQLSGGEQQRVALVRALAPRPRLMLMDEPFSGLDLRLRDEIRDMTLDLLREEGTAVLLVTHDPDEAMRMADEIALMRKGAIIQKGAPYNIYNAPIDKAAAAFFSDINVIKGLSNNSLTQTPFGQFLAPGLKNGQAVEIVIRPQHLKMDFDRNGRGPNATVQDGVPAKAVVSNSRFMGGQSLVEFKMESDSSYLKATVPAVFLPKKGTVLWLSMRRDRCFVFPIR